MVGGWRGLPGQRIFKKGNLTLFGEFLKNQDSVANENYYLIWQQRISSIHAMRDSVLGGKGHSPGCSPSLTTVITYPVCFFSMFTPSVRVAIIAHFYCFTMSAKGVVVLLAFSSGKHAPAVLSNMRNIRPQEQ